MFQFHFCAYFEILFFNFVKAMHQQSFLYCYVLSLEQFVSLSNLCCTLWELHIVSGIRLHWIGKSGCAKVPSAMDILTVLDGNRQRYKGWLIFASRIFKGRKTCVELVILLICLLVFLVAICRLTPLWRNWRFGGADRWIRWDEIKRHKEANDLQDSKDQHVSLPLPSLTSIG